MTRTKIVEPTIADSRQSEYLAAQSRLETLTDEQAEAVWPQHVLGRWQSGDTEPTALDYLLADIETSKRLPALIGHATRALERAATRRVASTPDLADAAAAVLAEAFGETVTTHAVEPAGGYKLTAGLDTQMHVRQHGLTVRDVGGFLSGRLDVVYLRGEKHRSLDGKAVLAALNAQGWSFPGSQREDVFTEGHEAGELDRFTVEVAVGWPTDLVMPAGQVDLFHLAQVLAGGARDAALVSDATTTAGVRSVIVSGRIVAGFPRHGGRDTRQVASGIKSKLDAQVGKPFAGVGRLTAVQVTDSGVAGDDIRPTGAWVECRWTFASLAAGAVSELVPSEPENQAVGRSRRAALDVRDAEPDDHPGRLS